MVKIIEASASTFNITDFVHITFKLEDTYEDVSKYRFELYRSNFDDGKYNLILASKEFEFKDYGVNLNNPEVKHFYKIKAINESTNEYTWSSIIDGVYISEDNYMSAIESVYEKYLKVINNKELYLLKRIRHGQLCECFDDVRGESRNSQKCSICFGTGYVGGYEKVTSISVNFQNTSTYTENMDIKGTFEKNSPIGFWTANFPLIQEGDIVVDPITGDRFIIMMWQPSYKNSFLLRQTVQIDKVPESDIIYKLKI